MRASRILWTTTVIAIIGVVLLGGIILAWKYSPWVRDKRVEVSLLAAVKYSEDGNVDVAEEVLLRCVEASPLDPRPYLFLAELYRSQKNADRELEALNTFVDVSWRDTRDRVYRGDEERAQRRILELKWMAVKSEGVADLEK